MMPGARFFFLSHVLRFVSPPAALHFEKFLGSPARSKSQQLVTDPRHERSHVGLKTSGWGYRQGLSAPA